MLIPKRAPRAAGEGTGTPCAGAPTRSALQGCSPAPHSHVPDDPSQPLRFRAFYGHRLRRRQMLPDPNNPCQTGAGTQPGAPGDTPKSFLRSLLGAAHGTPTSWLPCAGLGGEKADPKYSARVLRAPRGPECPPKLSPELAACGQGEKQSHSRGMKGAAANTTPNFLLRGVSNGTGSSVSPWHGDSTGRGRAWCQPSQAAPPLVWLERGPGDPKCAHEKLRWPGMARGPRGWQLGPDPPRENVPYGCGVTGLEPKSCCGDRDARGKTPLPTPKRGPKWGPRPRSRGCQRGRWTGSSAAHGSRCEPSSGRWRGGDAGDV